VGRPTGLCSAPEHDAPDAAESEAIVQQRLIETIQIVGSM
jgi:hypothetical protein